MGNVMETQEVTFTGTLWDNVSSTHISNPELNWAFAMVGQLDARISAQDNILAINRNCGWIGQRHGDQYTIVVVDQDRQPVVGFGDRIEINEEDLSPTLLNSILLLNYFYLNRLVC